jgi:predicted dienelactone hydrolase
VTKAAVADQPSSAVYGDYREPVAGYLKRLYDPAKREHAFRKGCPGGPAAWRNAWRAVLLRLLGLETIAAAAEGHHVKVDLAKPEDLGRCTPAQGSIETELHVQIPFWLLRPAGEGPFPLAVLPHGHAPRGQDTTAGVHHDEAHRQKSLWFTARYGTGTDCNPFLFLQGHAL